MANPQPDDNLRPDQDNDLEKNWRERYPGWETYEGRPNDPRLASKIDPNQDIRFDTSLKSGSVVTRRPGAVVVVLGVVAGVLLMILVALLMYRHFQTPSPRSPQPAQTGTLVAPATARMEDSIADNALPLRKEHHIHDVGALQQPGSISAAESPAAPESRRASIKQ